MSDVPIDPQDFTGGLKVVDIGDLRVARGWSRRPAVTCRHLNMTYDDKERRIWCSDCETEVEPYDAFKVVCENIDTATKRLKRREASLKEAEQFALRSRAAKVMDGFWRGRSLAPLCPHCNEALLPEDVVNGLAGSNPDWVRRLRKKHRERK
ncbi:hypothetical protein [Salinicola peritrichatus]|uniref:hypothetical protein n=1 Tax=Salinicola peritrichatus TaxID=1267424 RepID=UPI000DA130D2|nr:hypothetical protein [Salinicola peritrichatus]